MCHPCSTGEDAVDPAASAPEPQVTEPGRRPGQQEVQRPHAAAGAISGLWAGLLIGALLALFTTGHTWLAVLLVAVGWEQQARPAWYLGHRI
jgi:hypothetical protein